MIVIIATAIACFIVGGVLSYILFRYALKSKYDNVPVSYTHLTLPTKLEV